MKYSCYDKKELFFFPFYKTVTFYPERMKTLGSPPKITNCICIIIKQDGFDGFHRILYFFIDNEQDKRIYEHKNMKPIKEAIRVTSLVVM